MRVLLTSHGSTGDLYPVIAYGRALAQAGHSVTFASAPLFQREIKRANLDYYYLPPDWEQEIFTEFMRRLHRARYPIKQLREIYRGALPFLGELIDRLEEALETHDVLCGLYLFPHFRALAERKGKPFASIALCHNTIPSRDYPPEPALTLRGFPKTLQAHWNMGLWRLVNCVVDKAINRTIGDILEEKGLPDARNFIMKPADLVLVAVSPSLMAGRGSVPRRFQFTGFLRWQAEACPAEENRIVNFCGGEPVPVLTFGSVAFDDTTSIMRRFERNWPVGKKIIIQTGWSGLSVEMERHDILVVGKMSHDQLFGHASCVVHHGGAGTTASALSAGKPHIIVPHIADQDFWGSEIERLGTGVVLPRNRWPEKLPGAIRLLETRGKFREKAWEVRDTMAREDGAKRAIELLQAHVEAHNLNRRI
ncbi:MAG: hypothetical protein F7O42_03170 [Opitutae bacterium]|nr:hypothetical protein [Opitutae bacterium]